MIRFLLGNRRLRWLALGYLARYLARRSAARSVDRATASLEDRLPAPVAKALDAVPVEVTRAGGSMVVAAKAARSGAVTTRRFGRLGRRQVDRLADARARLRSVRGPRARLRAVGAELRGEVGAEVERSRRDLTSQYYLATRGQAAADDALLDLRAVEPVEAAEVDDGPTGGLDPLPEPPAPVRRGRHRAPRRRPGPVVARVQRTYQRPLNPWDR